MDEASRRLETCKNQTQLWQKLIESLVKHKPFIMTATNKNPTKNRIERLFLFSLLSSTQCNWENITEFNKNLISNIFSVPGQGHEYRRNGPWWSKSGAGSATFSNCEKRRTFFNSLFDEQGFEMLTWSCDLFALNLCWYGRFHERNGTWRHQKSRRNHFHGCFRPWQ